MAPKGWTDAQFAVVVAMVGDGKTAEQISKKVGKSRSAVLAVISRHGLRTVPVQTGRKPSGAARSPAERRALGVGQGIALTLFAA